MKKSMILFGLLSIGFTHAQQGRTHAQHTGATKRVGINTETPVASLEISKLTGVPAKQVQGLVLPHLSQTERNAMEKTALVNGVMIFNTTKNCIDWWNGTKWQCMDNNIAEGHGEGENLFYATYANTYTKEFTRECPAEVGGGSTVTVTRRVDVYETSTISQEDANKKAEAKANAEFEQYGQTVANALGKCRRLEYILSPTCDIPDNMFHYNIIGGTLNSYFNKPDLLEAISLLDLSKRDSVTVQYTPGYYSPETQTYYSDYSECRRNNNGIDCDADIYKEITCKIDKVIVD